MLDLAAACSVVSRTGTWFGFGETRLGQGRENARQFLRDNPDILKQIRAKVLELKRPKPAADESPAAAAGPAEEERKPARAAAPPARKPLAAAGRRR
jgi:recombination protein RecA